MRNSLAELYGKGIFTTIAICGGVPFLWEKHWRRLSKNAAELEIDISEYSEAEILETLKLEFENKNPAEGQARITFSDESPSEKWGSDSETKTSLSIITAERRQIPELFKLTVSPHRINSTSPLIGIKSCNYLEHLLAYNEARERGFHEAIRLNERGEITSACMSNVFWLKDELLYTPSMKTGCLAGTTREYILEDLECEEIEARAENLENADAIYLSSAGIGIVQVVEFAERRFVPIAHPIENLWPKL